MIMLKIESEEEKVRKRRKRETKKESVWEKNKGD